MRASLSAAMVGFAILSTASAVQLANFQNIQISNAQCRAAYTTNIEGCVASDFDPPATARCTEACVQGLKKIGEVVKRVCKDVDVGETSIIGVFQNDIGVTALCPRIATGVSSTTSSARAPERTSAQPQASSRAQSSSAAPQSSTLVTSSSSTTSTSASSSQSEAAQSPSSSSQGLLVDPNPTSIAAGSPTNVAPQASSTRGAGPTRAPNAQLSNADSGGGSPFDVQAVTGASSQLRVVGWTMGAFVSTALLFGTFV